MSAPAVPREELDLAHFAIQRGAKDSDEQTDKDEDLDLPPLDDDDGDGDDTENEETAELDPDLDDRLAALDKESADPFDDATAAELDTGISVGDDDEVARGEDEPAGDELDVGALDEGMVVRDTYGDSGDEKAEEGGDEDFEISPDTRGVDDGGVEGTDESTEDDVNEADLPALDADEEGDFEGEDVLREMTFEADSTLPPWDAHRWTTVEGAGATVPCAALAIAAGRVAAGGEVALVVDEGAHAARRAGFEGGASSVAITEDGALVVAHRGHLWISRDGGRSAGAVGGWRGGRGPVTLATTPGRVWILSEGSLWSMSSSGSGQAAQARSKGVRTIATTGGAVVALTQAAAGAAIERLRGDDEGWQATSLIGAAKKAAESEGTALTAAAGGRLIAIADRGAVYVSRDGGQTFAAIPMPETAALAFVGDDERAPLLALLARDVDASAYVALIPAGGEATRIADLPSGAGDASADSDEDAFGAAAMGWDATREVAWVACRAGLFALARARKH